MKNLIVTIIMLLCVTSISNAQFSLSTSVGQGIKINEDFKYEQFQSTIDVVSAFAFGRFYIGLVALIVLTDSTFAFFLGVVPSYDVWKSEEVDRSIGVEASVLFGLFGETLLGLGGNFKSDGAIFGINASRELTNNEWWIQGTVGYTILK